MKKIDQVRAGLLAFVMVPLWVLPLSAAGKKDFDGKTLFEINCAVCHGATGAGNGAAAQNLEVAPKPLATLTKRNGGTFPEDYVRRIIDGREELRAHRTGAMPVWGTYFRMRHDGLAPDASTETIVQFLVEYVRSVQTE